MPKHIFVTGGARSGKSRFAESQALTLGGRVIYLATAQAGDAEMAERIKKHRQRRPADWETVEAPLEVAKVLRQYQEGCTILFDCLTMYLNNLYFSYETTASTQELPALIERAIADLAEIISSSSANLIIVTNEVGWSIVPDNPTARTFRDLAGIANQRIAAVCDQVYLVVSGIPVKIKGATDV